MRCLVASQIKRICERLKRLGFARESRVKLYGEEFQLTSDPFVLERDVIFVDSEKRNSNAASAYHYRLPKLLGKNEVLPDGAVTATLVCHSTPSISRAECQRSGNPGANSF
jgi:hypothetical protein